MNHTLLNEHDANQGAQSRGEFLGMTGNSGWYLLGSIGASLLIVILCWGMLGISLLLCLLVGVVLCGLSVAYVFALKNNRPEHYDTDFFESALIEAGLMQLSFGPRQRRIANPFNVEAPAEAATVRETTSAPVREAMPKTNAASATRRQDERRDASPAARTEPKRTRRELCEPVVSLAAYENVREELDFAEELLEDAVSERAEG